MKKQAGRPEKPEAEKLYQRNLHMTKAEWAKVEQDAIKHGFVYESKKKAGKPDVNTHIRSLVGGCE